MVERGSFRFLAGQLVILTVAGCSVPATNLEGGPGPGQMPASDHAIRGRVEWPSAPARNTQVLIGDLANGASVNLIDAQTGFTKCATIASPEGTFVLEKCGVPDPRPYILEAQKGLGDQKLGFDSARLRAFIKFEGGQWRGMHASQSGIVISPSTAALVLMQQGLALAPEDFIGSIVSSGTPYDTISAVVDTPTYQAVTDMVRQALANDSDPVQAVSYSGTAFSITLGTVPAVAEIKPASAFGGNKITLVGRNLANPSSVTIGGKTCPIDSSTPTSIVATLPHDAATGPLVVNFPSGPSTIAITYTVESPLSGRYKPEN